MNKSRNAIQESAAETDVAIPRRAITRRAPSAITPAVEKFTSKTVVCSQSLCLGL